MEQNVLSLDEVKLHFEHWRATRTKKRERIPKHLWDEVKTLIDRYSLADITKALSINTGQMKDNLKSTLVSTQINFVEAQTESPSSLAKKSFIPFPDSKQMCSIELHLETKQRFDSCLTLYMIIAWVFFT
ncbi:MAG: hypothetical protein H0W64_10960 [Gammaproteobacteria bacterium]|nr:hypothetical protein [Gammaproteobacteria bacterium]